MCLLVKKKKYGLVGYNFNNEINKIFKNDRAADIFSLAKELGMHRFFKLNISSEKEFDSLFDKMIIFMRKVDYMVSEKCLLKLTDPEFLKKEKQKSIYKVRCLAFAYVFYEGGLDYVKDFLDKFFFRMVDEEQLNQIVSIIEELKVIEVKDKKDYKEILTIVEHLIGFNGNQFFLNICYYCSVLETTEEIDNFIDYYSNNAKRIFYEYNFKELGLDEISSDEEIN